MERLHRILSRKKQREDFCGEPPTPGQTRWVKEGEPGLYAICHTPEAKKELYTITEEDVRRIFQPTIVEGLKKRVRSES